jgi:hypothetical protein
MTLGKEEMEPRFTIRVFGSGHTSAEVEAAALTRAAALSGWQGPMHVAQPYNLEEMPAGEIPDGGAYVYTGLMREARAAGHPLFAVVSVHAEQPDTIDLNEVLAEALNAVDAWEIADLGSDYEREAAMRLTEAFSTIHVTLRDGGRLPDPWAGAAGRAPQADAGTVSDELNRVFKRLGAVLDKLDEMSGGTE